MRPGYVIGGVVVLVAVWLWPLPHLGVPPFSAHMTMHMSVVAIAAPLLAMGLAGGRFDPVLRIPALFAAVPASMLELVLVWGWHAPALHHAARTQSWAFVLEQGSFLIAGIFLWVSALGGTAQVRRLRATGGVTGLLLTAMHMTLLGALLALTPRELYQHHHAAQGGHEPWLSPLHDQQLGGAIMLLVGGIAYLTGGLGLAADALRQRRVGEGRR